MPFAVQSWRRWNGSQSATRAISPATPSAPIIKNAQPPEKAPAPVSLKGLWAEYIQMRMQTGGMRDGGKRQGVAIEGLCKFVKHDDAARLKRKDIIAWRDHLRKSLSARTISDVHLSTVRSLLNWAVENEKLAENVAATVKQPKMKKVYGRERGYTDAEAVHVLKASRSYQPKVDEFGRVRESEKAANLKRWVPILCAFTGARVAEITQLRKEDIRKVDGQCVARITPDAGTVKAGGYRDVPLHWQIIDEGFAEFVENAPPGPLFHNTTEREKVNRAVVNAFNKMSEWLRLSKLTPEGLQPNHAWRHRLKTQCREHGISDRVVDAIQGHSGKTAADSYGDVTLKTKIDAIGRLPAYHIH